MPVTGQDFLFMRHPEKPWTLIIPRRHGIFWTGDMLWYRSRIQHDDGRIVSLGLPKFRNLGDWEADRAQLDKAIAEKRPVQFSEKLDGTLVIRSVFEGEVIVRMRNHFGLDPEFGTGRVAEINALIDTDMPELRDPDFGSWAHLLFEYVSPINQIVVRHETPRLVCIGAVDPAGPRVMSPLEVQSYLCPPHWHFAESDCMVFASVPDLCEHVERTFAGREGIVVKIGSTLLKIKTAEYLRMHRQLSTLTAGGPAC
jgi:hypothetical protein